MDWMREGGRGRDLRGIGREVHDVGTREMGGAVHVSSEGFMMFLKLLYF